MELKVDRSLINNLFDGYKLSSNNLTTSYVETPPVEVGTDSSTIFSYEFSKCLQLHNHLYRNPWNDDLYFVDKNFKIHVVKGEVSNSSQLSTVFQISVKKTSNRLACSIVFPSKDKVLLSDGSGKIYLYEISYDNDLSPAWTQVGNEALYAMDSPSLLKSAEMVDGLLHLMAISLNHSHNVTSSKVMVHWIQFSVKNDDNSNNFSLEHEFVFSGKNVPKLCWFSESLREIFILSEQKVQQVDAKTHEPIEDKNSEVGNVRNGCSEKVYKWCQSKDMICITYEHSLLKKDDIIFDITQNYISVVVKNHSNVIIQGELEKQILTDPSKWFILNGKLEIALLKKEVGLFWSSVIPDDQTGEHVIEGEEEQKIAEIHQQLEHLTSSDDNPINKNSDLFYMQQLEECDENTDIETNLFLFDVVNNKCKRLGNVGNHQWIFGANLSNKGPVICLRHDVDGVVWQSSKNVNEIWKHVSTFDAFGYILASKREQKFVACAPNFSYACIIDCTSHVYIYEGNHNQNTTSRNFQNNYKQHVVRLDSNFIYGFQILNDALYIMTDSKLYKIDVR